MNPDILVDLNMETLFDHGRYLIPIYQRNYSWEEKQITQLIQDIYDSFLLEKSDNEKRDEKNKDEERITKKYFIGTLVVNKETENGQVFYETIDGQQRLTTLNILFGVLHREFKDEIGDQIKRNVNYHFNLKFYSREKSTKTLQVIADTDNPLPGDFNQADSYNYQIVAAYNIALKKLKSLFENNTEELNGFYNYLIHKVNILRVPVPEDTDLNHYFEIMNTRGEQLEKHEVLKAKLMDHLKNDDKDMYVFNRIWEACADMDRYVQYGFSPGERDKLFTLSIESVEEWKWNEFNPTCFDNIYKHLIKENEGKIEIENAELTIEKIINSNGDFTKNKNEVKEAPDQFRSIIDFPNFLLHILRIQMGEDVPLDDKRLIESFEKYLKVDEKFEEENKSFVKSFCFNLLKGRWLFDHYIIKREYKGEAERWSLKRLKWNKNNNVSYVNTRQILDDEKRDYNKNALMLLAMFHVSAPTRIYKYWLNAALLYCFKNHSAAKKINFKEYILCLENLAQSYFYDRYLSIKEEKVSFYDIIYKNDFKSQNKNAAEKLNWEVLNTGTQVENFIFNYLDYILWLKESDGYDKFEFSTANTSVEHYYPRNPLPGIEPIPDVVDNFGNLCLLSPSKNSKLSNNSPSAKKEHYDKVGFDSLKQKTMMNCGNWGRDEIKVQTEKMINVLKKHNPFSEMKVF